MSGPRGGSGPGGCLVQGSVWSQECVWSGGVCLVLGGMSAPGGGVWYRRVSGLGVCLVWGLSGLGYQTGPDTPPMNRILDTCL